MNIKWTNYEKEFIRVNADKLTDAEVLRQLQEMSPHRKLSLHSLRKVRQKMGLKKNPGRGVCSIR